MASRRGKTKVKLNSDGVASLLLSPGLSIFLMDQGSRVAARMAALAPRESGRLASSHYALLANRGDRMVVEVGSDLNYAYPIAVSTGYMARALDGDSATAKFQYTTKSGKKIWATQAQIDNWTRGSRS